MGQSLKWECDGCEASWENGKGKPFPMFTVCETHGIVNYEGSPRNVTRRLVFCTECFTGMLMHIEAMRTSKAPKTPAC